MRTDSQLTGHASWALRRPSHLPDNVQKEQDRSSVICIGFVPSASKYKSIKVKQEKLSKTKHNDSNNLSGTFRHEFWDSELSQQRHQLAGYCSFTVWRGNSWVSSWNQVMMFQHHPATSAYVRCLWQPNDAHAWDDESDWIRQISWVLWVIELFLNYFL